MLGLYLHMLESAHEVDEVEERTFTRRENLDFRKKLISISEAKFRKRYRLSKSLFSELVDELSTFMPPTLRSDALDVESKILLTLAFYATGSYQTPIGDSRYHPVSQTGVSKAIAEVTAALNRPDVLNKYVAFPFHQRDRERVKRHFYSATRMPGVLGCVDGTHVAIVKPIYHEERYINRKKYHSLNVLIMCDSDLNITSVNSSFPGSTHDSKVWEDHKIKKYIEGLYQYHQEDVYILGDLGYPLRETLMTPLADAEPGSPEAYYTDLHVSARSVVERCIGFLKARFRCLLADRTLHYSPATAARITNACCVLHNIAHGANVEYEPLTAEQLRRERQLTVGASFPAPRDEDTPATIRAMRARELRAGRQRRTTLIRLLWRQRNLP